MHCTVTENDTATMLGSGDVPVLATPRLIAWMEAATTRPNRFATRATSSSSFSRQTTGSIPFAGVFFSTFFGGHETSWGPKKEVHAYFSNFKVGTTKL